MLDAVDWSVVVVGRWNRSILTPAGIGKHLFKLPEETPLEVELAIDAMLPPRITHKNLRVTVSSQHLTIDSLGCNFLEIDQARDFARNAMESLKETPIAAAGVNIKYHYKEADEHLARVLELMSTEFDDWLSTGNTEITKRSLTRSMLIGDGQLNLILIEDEKNQLTVQFNYELASAEISRLNKWLQSPIKEYKEHSRNILTNALEIPENLIPDG